MCSMGTYRRMTTSCEEVQHGNLPEGDHLVWVGVAGDLPEGDHLVWVGVTGDLPEGDHLVWVGVAGDLPEGDHLMWVGVAGDGLCPGEPEVCQLELPIFRYEQILGLHVPENDQKLKGR